ncbi:MAG: hypothetical protein JW809_18260 [Pirellulales bacterium]|nr:hypothetical protein [Pirellulales bacterium]
MRFRVWIVRCDRWRPRSLHDVPPSLVVVELAEPDAFSAEEARRYVAAFNRAVLQDCRTAVWAVAVPVAVHGGPVPPLAPGNPPAAACAQKEPAVCLPGVDTQRASTAGIRT